jgi:transcriptional regulator with XRE-family HTH domain
MPANQPSVPEGTILRRLRLQQGLRVNELARRASVSSATITLLEQGARRASPELLSRLSAALQVEPAILSDIAAAQLKAPLLQRSSPPGMGNALLGGDRLSAVQAEGLPSRYGSINPSQNRRNTPQQARAAHGLHRYGPPNLGDLADELAQLIATESNPKRAEHRAIMRVLRRLCAYFDSPTVATTAHIARCWPRPEDDGIITRLQITQTFGRDAPIHFAIGFRLGDDSLCGRALDAHMTLGKRGLEPEPAGAAYQHTPDILQTARTLDQQMPFLNFGNQRSGLATPIIKFGSRVAGVLIVSSPQPDYFRNEDSPVLEAFARLLTLCMQDFYDWNTVHLASNVPLHEPDVPPLSLRDEG